MQWLIIAQDGAVDDASKQTLAPDLDVRMCSMAFHGNGDE